MARILIAEDQSDLRDMMSSSMQMEGHEVSSISNGKDVLKKAKESSPDLVILDIHLPQISGTEICRQLKGLNQFAEIPILMISAEASAEEVEASLKAGAGAFLDKPFTIENLVVQVNQLLD